MLLEASDQLAAAPFSAPASVTAPGASMASAPCEPSVAPASIVIVAAELGSVVDRCTNPRDGLRPDIEDHAVGRDRVEAVGVGRPLISEAAMPTVPIGTATEDPVTSSCPALMSTCAAWPAA